MTRRDCTPSLCLAGATQRLDRPKRPSHQLNEEGAPPVPSAVSPSLSKSGGKHMFFEKKELAGKLIAEQATEIRTLYIYALMWEDPSHAFLRILPTHSSTPRGVRSYFSAVSFGFCGSPPRLCPRPSGPLYKQIS